MLLYTLAMTWLALAFGLLAKTPEGAGAFSFIVMFLPYCSSGFVPTDTMPAALRAFARHQPLTSITESLRALLLGGPDTHFLTALLWCAGLILAGYTASRLLFRRQTA